MTTPSTARKAGPFNGNGSTTSFPFTFKVFAAADIAVTIANSLGVETALVLDTDYSVSLNANQETSPGGTITYPISGTPLATGSVLAIVGDLDYDQPLDLPSGGNFSPLALENQLDRTVMQIQQLREEGARSLRIPVTSDADTDLPMPEAGQLIGWNAGGTALENIPVDNLATAVGYGTFRYDTFAGDGSTTEFALTADPAAVGNLDVAIDGLTQVPGTDYNLVSGEIVFTAAPSNGAEILARYGQALPITGPVDASAVTYQPAGTGAVATTVQTKLRESVSVKDFGAIGDGVTDDTAAIQAALTYLQTQTNGRGGALYLPAGIYQVTSIAFVYQTGGGSNAVTINIKGDGQQSTVIRKSGGTTTPVLDLSVNALGNGVYSHFEDFQISGNGLCPGLRATLFARFTTKNLRIRNCTTGFDSVGTLICTHDNIALESNQTGFKCVKSGSIYPNLVEFRGGMIFQNTTTGADIGEAQNVFFNSVDIELNGTSGDSSTAGIILRSNNGTTGSQSTIGFNGSWLEGNKGAAQLLVENATYLNLSLRDINFAVGGSANNLSFSVGAINSLLVENCSSFSFADRYNVGAAAGFTLVGGSVSQITNTALKWEYRNAVINGTMVPLRIGGTTTGLGTYNQTQNRHNSGTGNVSAPTSGSPVTLFSVSGSGPRMYNVFCCLGGAGASYTANARIAWDGTNLVRMGGENAANMTITVSGTNVQATQSSAVSQTIFYVYDLIG